MTVWLPRRYCCRNCSPRPLQLCEKREERPGAVRRVLDEDIQSSVVELDGDNLCNTWLRFPPEATDGPDSKSLHLRLPIVVFQLKNLGRHVSLEVQVDDARGQRRRFRASTFQKNAVVHEVITTLPLHLDPGWNRVQLDLAALTAAAYNAQFVHAVSVQLHSSCRVRRIFFADRGSAGADANLPIEFRLFRRLSKPQIASFRLAQRRQEQQQQERQEEICAEDS